MIRLLSLALSMTLLQAAQPPVTEPTREACEIRGRVTDRETGAPIVRAVVQLYTMGKSDGSIVVAQTDEDGVYRFSGLRAGPYSVMAKPGEFRSTHVIAFGPGAEPQKPLRLKPGEHRSGVDFALARASAIDVRVVDEWGEPLATVGIGVNAVGGSLIMPSDPRRQTDDRGRVRIFGLPAGRYLVCAEPFDGSFFTRETGAREQFLRTCYSSAGADAEAEPVQVGPSEAAEIVIHLRRGRTFAISGIVIDASGSPAPGALVGITKYMHNGSSSSAMPAGADARFTIGQLLPGDYALDASLGGPEMPEQRRALEVAFQTVHVESEDVGGLVLAMRKGVDVAGRVTVDDPAVKSPSGEGSGLMIYARLAGDRLPGMGSARQALMMADRTFVLTGLTGPRTFDVVNLPQGWYVKSIRYRGTDVTDEPVELKPSDDDSPALEIVLSAHGASVSGHAVGDGNQPVQDWVAVMFTVDPAHWNWSEPTRASVSADGAFKLGPRRPGSYFVVALDSSDPLLDGGNRDLFARLAKIAERITLAEDEERSLDLRVVHIR